MIDLEQIKELLHNIDDSINIDDLKSDHDLFRDNFLDSLQAVELFVLLEQKFNFNIDEYEKRIKNYKVKSIMDFINEK